MKNAKINSVYGGGGRKRCNERVEESGNSSKSASLTEKGRTNGVRATKALSTIPNNRTIVTRSMAMKTTEQEDEETLYEVQIVGIRGEEKNDDNKPMELVEEQEQQQHEQEPVQEQKQEPQPQPPANEVDVAEKKGDSVEELTLDDWPITFRFDEEWPWSKVRYDSGWYSCWETMNGDFWTPVRDHSQESVSSGDLWEFKP
ncbi:hypothetical protein J1N35_002497 [Gossypium stocksii]|uniref:Uncharacterized protein n=1 Tax=Gossypium stocksii TaxID=47602 RepID=A0A9D4ANK3_9ROSI|nr:hypothetical protein J1N35_002497 [Gossypium stocksii]